jgi:DHA1 family tetracycline resistance protein-like MFS transporter
MIKRSPLLVIFITIFIDLVGFGIVIPVLPFYVESEKFNATPRSVGLLFASFSVMQLIFSPILGRLSDKYGRRPVLLLSLIGTGIGFLIMGFATTLWMLFAGRVLDGITGGNISTAQAYIADITSPEERAKGMGIVGAAFGLGFIFGPPIGGILSRWGIGVPFIFAACLAFANAVLLYFTLPETVTPDHPARVRSPESRWAVMMRALSQPRLGFVLLIYFLFVVSFSIMTTTFALYTMYRFDYDAQANGYLFLFIGGIAALVQGVLIGKLVTRFGEIALVIAGALIFTISLFVVPFVGPHAGGLLALLLICGVLAIGNSLATPALTSLSSKSVGRGDQGSVLGVTQSAASLARVVGPLLSAFLIYSAIGPKHISDASVRATFWVASAIMFIAFVAAVIFARSHAHDFSNSEIAPASS